MVSRREQGPVAFRPRLSAGLALSDVTEIYAPSGDSRQFGDVPICRWSQSRKLWGNDRLGSRLCKNSVVDIIILSGGKESE